jgi:hypothetical protein
VSYPPAVDFGLPTPIELPKGLSTVFEVTWADKGGATPKKRCSASAERHHPIYYALEKINELLLAYKLIRVGHLDGMGIRTVGIGDTLFYFSNAVAYEGYQADYSTAAKAIYACTKTLVVLRQDGLIESDFPVEMFRHAKITAAWAEDPPKWVPEGADAESFTFD